jgi:hypothetical protein
MQERVEAYNGTFTAGPKEGGGYDVLAVFPSAPTSNRRPVVNPAQNPT